MHPAHASFLSGTNATFIAELYQRYLTDPNAIDPSWSGFFVDLDEDSRAVLSDLRGASWAPSDRAVIGASSGTATATAVSPQLGGEAGDLSARMPGPWIHHSAEQIRQAVLDSLRALMLIRIYRVRGHLMADLDPLGLDHREPHPELDPATYGFTEADLDRTIYINYVLGLESATLRQILDIVRKTYCGSIGVEFMHIQDPAQKAWIQERIESQRNQTDFTVNGKRAILERLTAAEVFERFLQLKYTGTKRFGLEGAETLIPALEQVLKRGGQLGLKEVVLGMAHRGRLNVLANFMNKPFQAIFSEFQGNAANPEDVQGSGDVKYHLGTSSDRDFNGNVVHLSLTANPSHLEAVNPVVLGKVRAKQWQRGDTVRRESVMGILLHGDAAFAGQGLVPESLLLSELPGYRTGGTVHFVINNQIGFTTHPSYSRSGPYPTEVAKSIQAPIFHVNGDDPEAVVHVSRIAIEFRQRFQKDVVVDMFCYRRQGHNESDEPGFTQPVMYRKIKELPTTRAIYARQLEKEQVVTRQEAERMISDFMRKLELEFEVASTFKPAKADWLEGAWSGMEPAGENLGETEGHSNTGVPLERLQQVGKVISTPPAHLEINSKIIRQMQAKAKAVESGQGIDWATAEALAFGSLVLEHVPVRLSGQDCGRGTFSQRHAVLVDQKIEQRWVPLEHIQDGQASFFVHDSPLSEAAVLGFEYGVSLAEPKALVMWEAQFGDFVNGAQMIIDQFISSGEAKWLRMSGLVMLLPHGFEGQGPEHSSARPERFLQLCAEDNWQVANCTTPANYFHILRRQVHRKFRKPLVIFTPKSLLRHKLCVSSLSDFAAGSRFLRVIPDETPTLVSPDKVRRVVVCTGKVYYDLWQEREQRKLNDVALVRLEQLYPFPAARLAQEFARYPNADVVWCQEEPANMGAWAFVDRRLETVLADLPVRAKRPKYAGRAEAAAPATGLLKRHNTEQAQLVDKALTVA